MSDHQTTPSPGIEPPEDETAQATQVIRTTDATQVIRAEDASGSTDTTQVMRTSEAPADSPDTIRLPTRAAAHAATVAQAAAEKAQTKAARPWFKRKRFALPSTVIAVFAFIMITTGGNDSGLFRAVTQAAQPTTEVGLKPPPATATIGQSVRDGKFAFMVTGIQQPTKTFTDRFGRTQSAQGVFVVIRVNAANIGYESRSLNATDLFLVDATGKRFATSSAISSMVGAETVFLHKINPGQSVTNAPVLFDVAPGTVATSIELHDSMTSRGVQVKLP